MTLWEGMPVISIDADYSAGLILIFSLWGLINFVAWLWYGV